METGCCGGRGETLVFTCAGAAYSGQVANRAGVQLMQQNAGSLFCIAAIAAGIDDKIDRARRAARRVTIDGCEDRCALKVLERAGLVADVQIALTDVGVEKKPAVPKLIDDARAAVEAVRRLLAADDTRRRG